MYRVKVKILDMFGYQSIIRKHFNTPIEARAYLDGLREGAELGAYKVTDLDDEERRKKWCNTQQ